MGPRIYDDTDDVDVEKHTCRCSTCDAEVVEHIFHGSSIPSSLWDPDGSSHSCRQTFERLRSDLTAYQAGAHPRASAALTEAVRVLVQVGEVVRKYSWAREGLGAHQYDEAEGMRRDFADALDEISALLGMQFGTAFIFDGRLVPRSDSLENLIQVAHELDDQVKDACRYCGCGLGEAEDDFHLGVCARCEPREAEHIARLRFEEAVANVATWSDERRTAYIKALEEGV